MKDLESRILSTRPDASFASARNPRGDDDIDAGSTVALGMTPRAPDLSERHDASEQIEAALRASEQRFHALVSASAQVVWTTDGDGNVVRDSPSWRAFTGQSIEAWHAFESRLACVHPNDRMRVLDEARDARARRVALTTDFRLLHRSGEWREMTARLVPVTNDDGNVREWVGMLSDVTERRRSEARASANERLRERSKFFDLSADMTCIASLDGRLLQVNEAFTRTLGYDRDEMTERDFMDFVHEDDIERTSNEIVALAGGAGSADFTNRYRCKDGSYRWLSWRSNPQPDGTIYAMARDITAFREMFEALQTKQDSLAAGIHEREVLLQEVHHRVKNNLQIVSSMMNMQLRKVAHDAARVALEECQSRVQAIALIHEKLYQSKDYARIPFRDYVRNLVHTIFEATGTSRTRIRCDIDMTDISLGVDRAIPCGLLLNELVTNALKHAFRDGRDGTLRIALYELPDRRLRLVVADDGVGLPNGFDLPRSESLGVQLVSTLVDQLDAELDIDGRQGMTFRITMPPVESRSTR